MIIEKYHNDKIMSSQFENESSGLECIKYHTSKDYVMKQIEDIYELKRD